MSATATPHTTGHAEMRTYRLSSGSVRIIDIYPSSDAAWDAAWDAFGHLAAISVRPL